MGGGTDLVVVGASLAGLNAARAGLEHASQPRVTLIGAEILSPYDRPPLSKAVLRSETVDPPSLLGAADVLDHPRCRVLLGTPAVRLEPSQRRVIVGHRAIDYDALVIATGSRPRVLPGVMPAGVHVLRAWDDAVAIRARLQPGARLVVIGAGFIGSEVAASAVTRGVDVTIVEAAPVPLVRAVGPTAGVALASIHARHGVEVLLGVGVDAVVGSPDVTGVRLTDGRVLPADVVVVGIGATPDTDWLSGSGVLVDSGVVCDDTLRSSVPGVYAAGDVARWINPTFDRALRLEHWTSAQEQGGHAARNALDPTSARPYAHVPYFWSDWYDSHLQFVGIPSGEPELLEGDWEATAFTAAYAEGDRLVGVLAVNRRADIMKYRALISARGSLDDARTLAEQRRAARAAKNPPGEVSR